MFHLHEGFSEGTPWLLQSLEEREGKERGKEKEERGKIKEEYVLVRC